MLRSLPTLILGVVLAAYWGRVLRMAWKARRQTGRAGNIVPAESLGRWLRIIWTPVIFIWIFNPFAIAFWRALPSLLRPIYFTPWIAWPGAIIAGSCLYFSRLCWKTMGRAWRMGIDPAERNQLIIAGPFAYVRHPIYALSALMMLATAVSIPSTAMLAAGIIHIALLVWESRREERHLFQVHAEVYSNYKRRVGGFLPRLKQGRYDVRQATVRERSL